MSFPCRGIATTDIARFLAASLAICIASNAFAAETKWPSLFDVAGVDQTDTLNIREAPNASASIIGSFPSNETGIELIRPSDDGRWGLVNTGERTGWVSLAFLTETKDAVQGISPDIRQCFGVEPFWSLEFESPQITLKAPDIEPRSGLVSGVYRSRSRPGHYAEVGSFFPGEWGNRDITLSIRRESCVDGMSDREYGISVDMLIRRPDESGDLSMTGLYSGCCSLSPPPSR